LQVGGFPNLEPCWAEDLALQIWPVGASDATFWGLPQCVRRRP
jgi:hypothetical protein